jgi:hypothetical protein
MWPASAQIVRIRTESFGSTMMVPMTTIPANDVRIPSAVREALARHEPVMVLSHGRPVYVIVNPDVYEAGPSGSRARGRRLSEAVAILAEAPRPDPEFGNDLETIRASIGVMPSDPWERS